MAPSITDPTAGLGAINPIEGAGGALQSTPLTPQELAVKELGFTPRSLDPTAPTQSIGSPNSASPVEISPVEPTGPVAEAGPSLGEESFKDRFIEQLKNPVDAQGKPMEYGLGDYLNNPLHGMAAIGGTDMLLPYEEEKARQYASSGRDGAWSSGYGDYDSDIGPSWGRY
tara:strand:- start:53 stop:562 length:510 start_codon:yes stop_codon:yes gene_type:complete